MLPDIVVDTNVFLHSADPRHRHRVAAYKFLQKLKDGKTHLCIDEGFSIEECKNRSRIGCEYHDKIRFANAAAWGVIVFLGTKGRIRSVSGRLSAGPNKKIRMFVPDKTDRVFVKVSYNTQAKTLVSHDFTDFSQATRRELSQKLGVCFKIAPTALPLI